MSLSILVTDKEFLEEFLDKKLRNDNGWKDQDRKREYQRNWVRKRRQYYIDQRGGACERCGCTVDLEFHHTQPEIKVTHRIFSYSKERIEKELSTCKLLCRTPCHRKIEQKKANANTG